MNVITKEKLEKKLQNLENTSLKTLKHLKSLHRREKDIKLRELTENWVDAFLDLYHLRSFNVNYEKDPDWHRLCLVRDVMNKIRM